MTHPASPPEPPEPPPIDLLLTGSSLVLTLEGGSDLGRIAEGAVGIRSGKIVWIGPSAQAHRSVAVDDKTEQIDVQGRMITPGLIDAHTHPVFAGSRAKEFALRAQGSSYAQIQAQGGGILATVEATRRASAAELLASTRERLARMLAWGVTTAEAKSGYALLPDGELALLNVLKEASASQPIDLSPTLLAHIVAPEYSDRRSEYLDLLADSLIPAVAGEHLADAFDVYVEKDAFSPDEARTLLGAAKKAGLVLRVHAEQFSSTGGAELAAEMGALSAEHLEHVSDRGITLLAERSVVAVLLPGAALTLELPFPPARKLIDSGVRVALATDLNPGTSMTESLPLMMSLACMQMGMTVEEAWQAVTVHAARALGRKDIGRLVPGARADLCVFSCDDPAEIPYRYGTNLAWQVVKDGQVVWPRAKSS